MTTATRTTSWLIASSVALACSACGPAPARWRATGVPVPVGTARGGGVVGLSWELRDGARSPTDAPRTRVALVLSGAVETRLDGGVMPGVCRVAHSGDAQSVLPGAVTALVCAFEGAGAYYSVVRTPRDTLVVRGYDRVEPSLGDENPPRTNEREVARTPLPASASLRVSASEEIIGY